MWENWNTHGRTPEALRPLLQSFKPLLVRRGGDMKAAFSNVPEETVDAEMNKQFLAAIKTYNPTKAQLNTHIEHYLKKTKRFVDTYKNIGRIPDHRVAKVYNFKNEKERLESELRREPTTFELSTALGWSPREVSRLETEVRRENTTSRFEGMGLTDPTSVMPSEAAEVINLVKYELNPEEMLVYEYTFGMGGKPKLSPGDMAKQLNMSPSKVSRLRKVLVNKINKYY